MSNKEVLIVDDEKNIRLTLSRCVESLDVEVNTAVNGEDALSKLDEGNYNLMLLDLKMPGMNGMEVLEETSKKYPELNVIIITAYGSIEGAVKAMKLGAVDFIQKPVTPEEVRSIIKSVFDRAGLEKDKLETYKEHLEFAKHNINKRKFDLALTHIQKAIGIDSSKPEGFVLKGNLLELKGEDLEAQKTYRAALELEPTYKPAKECLSNLTSGFSKDTPNKKLGLSGDDKE